MKAERGVSDFETMQVMVRNLRNVLPPLTDGQSELVGLYMLNAYSLARGWEVDTFPVLDEKRPALRLVT